MRLLSISLLSLIFCNIKEELIVVNNISGFGIDNVSLKRNLSPLLNKYEIRTTDGEYKYMLNAYLHLSMNSKGADIKDVFNDISIKNDTFTVPHLYAGINIIKTDDTLLKIFILNATKRKGLAKTLSNKIKYKFGISNITVDNFDFDTVLSTQVYTSKKYLELTRRITTFLKTEPILKTIDIPYIIIVLGYDYIPSFNKNKNTQYHIVIKKSLFKLFLYKNNQLFKTFDIAIGLNPGDKQKVGDKRTPEGIFYISQVQDSKNWLHDFGDGKGPIKAYGPYFLRLYTLKDATFSGKSWYGIGIHGTHDPKSIGNRASEGCIRMHNKDLLELKKYVGIKTPVIIIK